MDTAEKMGGVVAFPHPTNQGLDVRIMNQNEQFVRTPSNHLISAFISVIPNEGMTQNFRR